MSVRRSGHHWQCGSGRVRTFVIPVQTVEGSNPDVSQIVFTAGSHEVGRDAVRVLCVVFKDFDGSVGFLHGAALLSSCQSITRLRCLGICW